MSVTIRTKPMQGGKLRLYFDFYPAIKNPVTNEFTRREVLTLFLYSDTEYEEVPHKTSGGNSIKKILPVFDKNGEPKRVRLTPIERQHNKETMDLAEAIRAQRVLQIQAEDYGFLTVDKNACFLEYLKKYADEQAANNNYNTPTAVYNYLHKFTKGVCPMSAVTTEFCQDFLQYLSTTPAFERGKKRPLSYNSVNNYFSVIRLMLKKALKAKLISSDPTKDMETIKRKDSKQREFLTYEELQKAAAAPCDLPLYKAACLFSALTGLRYSDVSKLKWGQVIDDMGQHSLRFISEKTERAETLPISSDAYTLLGERQAADQPVFPDLKYGQWQNIVIDRWIRGAGIAKHITFHCFRHTHAVLQLQAGTDIYTVSKLLGHRDVKTTQIYAKIVDESKRAAANRIKLPTLTITNE